MSKRKERGAAVVNVSQTNEPKKSIWPDEISLVCILFARRDAGKQSQ